VRGRRRRRRRSERIDFREAIQYQRRLSFPFGSGIKKNKTNEMYYEKEKEEWSGGDEVASFATACVPFVVINCILQLPTVD